MIRVLLVENNPADAQRALNLLREKENGQIEVTHVERLSSALHRLGRESFDAILMDRTLVDTHGLDTLDLIQAALGRMPIVVLGEKDDEAAERQMIQHGAQEVVIKEGSTSEQLTRALRHAVERKKAEQHLSYLAQHDPLTTLANRVLFRDRMVHAVAMAKRKKHVVGLMLCGLDCFTETSQTFGQESGDLLLKEVADRLKKCLREVDTAARLGGDEFTCLLEGINSRADMEIVGDRILSAFAKPWAIEKQEMTLTVSLGLVVYPLDGQEINDLFASAKAAMDSARESGGNRYCFPLPAAA
ncbi:MAG TPA: diguanylate cyclase [Nitrospiraceae bacterium]|nr:diguanylate cyclase [Nitrospiraceae bacterium]